jgi:hypothetical protein
MNNIRYRLGKLAGRKTGYPLATIAYYGPDDQFSSKVVVGIQRTNHEEDVNEIKRWFAKDRDVRIDEAITLEIYEYLLANEVHRVVMVDRIIGCPHEEGIDYPEGEYCPQCLYWENRDRWTGELINNLSIKSGNGLA